MAVVDFVEHRRRKRPDSDENGHHVEAVSNPQLRPFPQRYACRSPIRVMRQGAAYIAEYIGYKTCFRAGHIGFQLVLQRPHCGCSGKPRRARIQPSKSVEISPPFCKKLKLCTGDCRICCTIPIVVMLAKTG